MTTITNEHGLECPVPLEEWPRGCNFITQSWAGVWGHKFEPSQGEFSKIYGSRPLDVHSFSSDYNIWHRPDNQAEQEKENV